MSPLRYSNIPESIPWSRSRMHSFFTVSFFMILWFEHHLYWIHSDWRLQFREYLEIPFCDEVWEIVTPSSRGVWSSLTVRWKAETFYVSLKRTNLMLSEHKVSASWTTDSQISKISSSQPTLVLLHLATRGVLYSEYPWLLVDYFVELFTCTN